MNNPARLAPPEFEEVFINEESGPRPNGIYATAYAKLLELARLSDKEQAEDPAKQRRGIIIDLKSSTNGHRVCVTMNQWAAGDGYQLIFDKPINGTGKREVHLVPLKEDEDTSDDD